MLEPPRIISCQEWGSRSVHVAFAEHVAKGIVIHNTATTHRAPASGDSEIAAAKQLCRGIQAYHLDHNHWADTGQHFTVSRGGIILEGRHGALAAAREGHVVRGAHADNNFYNQQWFGIEVEGNYEEHPAGSITELQWASLVSLSAWLSYWGQFQSLNVRGHKQVAPPGHTGCPGSLMDLIPKLIDEMHNTKVQIMNSEG